MENKKALDIRKIDYPLKDPIDMVKEIIKEDQNKENSFYVVNLDDIKNKHSNWLRKLPRAEPHYAVKCNPDLVLIKTLAHLGANFDCASRTEIENVLQYILYIDILCKILNNFFTHIFIFEYIKVLDCDVSPTRIIYANPCKFESDIRFARNVGVDCMTFDNEMELHKIKANHAHAKCVLRIAVSDNQQSHIKFNEKFGADQTTSFELIKVAVELGLNLIGVCFHVGFAQSSEAFQCSIQNARQV